MQNILTNYQKAPEFYSCHKLLNTKTHPVYSDKLILNALSLKHIELATEEDNFWQIDNITE